MMSRQRTWNIIDRSTSLTLMVRKLSSEPARERTGAAPIAIAGGQNVLVVVARLVRRRQLCRRQQGHTDPPPIQFPQAVISQIFSRFSRYSSHLPHSRSLRFIFIRRRGQHTALKHGTKRLCYPPSGYSSTKAISVHVTPTKARRRRKTLSKRGRLIMHASSFQKRHCLVSYPVSCHTLGVEL